MTDPVRKAEPVDLTTCDREPIHTPGSIQDFGALVVCTVPEFRIVHVSANIEEYLGSAPADVLGSVLTSHLDDEGATQFRESTVRGLKSGAVVAQFSVLAKLGLNAAFFIHAVDNRIVVDIEREPEHETRAVRNALSEVQILTEQLERIEDLQKLLEACVENVRSVTGYDRVMVYRFLEDQSGQVVAEAARDGLTPYLNLRYPASDIPAQARELYRRQLLRMICDIDYTPVPLEPAMDSDNRPLDIGRSVLRSVSPIHLEYLRNMGVRATLTISLIVGGELWGLIACHHYETKHIPTSMRAALEVIGQIVALQIDAKQKEDLLRYVHSSRVHVDSLVAKFSPERDIYETLVQESDLLSNIVTSDSVVIFADDQISSIGRAPDEQVVRSVVAFLNKTEPGVYATHNVSSAMNVDTTDHAAGVLALPISRTPRDYILFFRHEVVKSVLWGGDPNKPAQYGPNGDRLTPRKSFEAWRETVRGQAEPWSAAETTVAETLRFALIEVALRHYDYLADQRKHAEERRELVRQELNHRIKNILALINSLVRKSGESAESIEAFIENVQGRIVALSRAHDHSMSGESYVTTLGDLAADVLSPWMSTKRQAIQIDGENVQLAGNATQTLALVFYELATNAAKYGALSAEAGSVVLGWKRAADDGLSLDWVEQGGPLVEMPQRKGFGSMVIEKMVELDLNGRVDVTYARNGLEVTVSVPAGSVRW